MGCGCGKSRSSGQAKLTVIRPTPRSGPSPGATEAIMAAIAPRFRVQKKDGTVTQKTWSSIVAATEAARSMGGTVVRD